MSLIVARMEMIKSRRELLVEQAEAQRAQVALIYHRLEKQMRFPEAAFRFGLSFHRKPWLVGLTTALVTALGNRFWMLPGKLWSVWKGAQWAYGLWKKARS